VFGFVLLHSISLFFSDSISYFSQKDTCFNKVWRFCVSSVKGRGIWQGMFFSKHPF